MHLMFNLLPIRVSLLIGLSQTLMINFEHKDDISHYADHKNWCLYKEIDCDIHVPWVNHI